MLNLFTLEFSNSPGCCPSNKLSSLANVQVSKIRVATVLATREPFRSEIAATVSCPQRSCIGIDVHEIYIHPIKIHFSRQFTYSGCPKGPKSREKNRPISEDGSTDEGDAE
ncbi:hypothetical protein BaRGS_00032535 [Batillaria attramentaria]|uniref:Uncharacterized protein n=1 Tax=Batillaria attramentaria TaxID=370345 RepID=A0ABD0JN62_9CAEN